MVAKEWGFGRIKAGHRESPGTKEGFSGGGLEKDVGGFWFLFISRRDLEQGWQTFPVLINKIFCGFMGHTVSAILFCLLGSAKAGPDDR